MFAWEYLPSATPKWQYLLKYTDGDLEHLPSYQVRNLFFVDNNENSEDDGPPNTEIACVEVQQDIPKSISSFNSADANRSKAESSAKSRTGRHDPKIAINLELKGSSLVDRFFRSLLPCSYSDPLSVSSESKSPSLASTECDVDVEATPSLNLARLDGKRKRNIFSLSGVTPLSSARIRSLLTKINYKFTRCIIKYYYKSIKIYKKVG